MAVRFRCFVSLSESNESRRSWNGGFRRNGEAATSGLFALLFLQVELFAMFFFLCVLSSVQTMWKIRGDGFRVLHRSLVGWMESKKCLQRKGKQSKGMSYE